MTITMCFDFLQIRNKLYVWVIMSVWNRWWFLCCAEKYLFEKNPLKSSPEVFVENRINHRIQSRIAVSQPKRQTWMRKRKKIWELVFTFFQPLFPNCFEFSFLLLKLVYVQISFISIQISMRIMVWKIYFLRESINLYINDLGLDGFGI